MSGWEEPPLVDDECVHPGLPKPSTRDRGRTWHCDCGARFFITVIDRMHDVMPGEKQVEAFWIPL
jgi:hypothetical protein